MKAIALTEYGSADDLRLADLPDPKVGPAEVLVRGKAAGVNPVDWKLAAGGLDALMEVRFPLVRSRSATRFSATSARTGCSRARTPSW